MLNGQRKTISDKSGLFIKTDNKPKYVRVSPESDEYLKVWVKEPTWLQVEQAMAVVMKLNPKTQEMDIDLNAMYRFIVDNFIEKTEPSLSAVELLKLNQYVGNQLKEILPNPLADFTQGDEVKKEQ
jgi:uncharacterized protein YfaT (DUF1175 family)|tara:strand:+ start:1775 stop:2152 length:378 start_codon:yes stop_codon:yes gene_type:complete